ncbi:hypothetical protein MUP77_12020 [Candidatus Bathyarchaeota archaeon]|nr:hypothetical protein [Candidatus Bathyarchaeota archaeon]
MKSGARGVVRFKEHESKVLVSVYSSTTADLGFPVVIPTNTYSKVKNLIDRYGSAHVEELRGTIESIPESFLESRVGRPILEWGSGIPQVGLIINSQRQIRHPGTPDRQNYGSVWNLGKSKNRMAYNYHIFDIGIEDYEYSIMNAVKIVGYEFETMKMEPLFDFDEIKSRFPEALYGPNYFVRKLEMKLQSPKRFPLEEKGPIILLCALHKEKEALEEKAKELLMFAEEKSENGIIEMSNRDLSRVIAVLKAIGRTGNRYSREALREITDIYNPRLVILFGIAAGIRGRVKIGDIIIADRVWDLRKCEILGSENSPKFRFEPEQLNSRGHILIPIQIGELEKMLRNEFSRNIVIHTDLLCGSSDNLIRNRAYMEAASKTNRKLGAVEMEAAGIAEICRLSNIPFIIVKAISDYGYDKADTYHEFCCQMVAKLLTKWITFLSNVTNNVQK